MAKQTKELQTLWWDWLSTAERLLISLHSQTAALTLRQVDKVEAIQPELDALTERMQQIDDRAAATALGLAEEYGVDPNLRSLVAALEKTEAQQVQALANRVLVVGRNIQNVVDKNRALLENELEFINGTVAIVVSEAGKSNSNYPGNKAETRNLMVDQAA
jgi:hypothetical protein